MAFDSILIANRGEIACRIIRSASALGLRTIAVYSDADEQAPHVQQADDSVRIGPAPVGDSYLNAEAIIAAARATKASAIHPGYGFLSENERFAEAVEDAGIVFVGPPAKAIYLMGNKAEAKRRMIAAGVACVPGYEGEDQSDETLIKAADEIGYPVMIKAAAGGGGRGMRLVEKPAALPDALSMARSEAENAFGSDELIIEKAVARPRHVEIQVFADTHGNLIHLGERDCSVQRRHQKVIEEAPCPVMTQELRGAMGAAAIAAAKAVDYRGAGTVEFLLDASGEFYFLEMNARLQVEHPVTEMITGLDLVALQIGIAWGDVLPIAQEDVRLDGHAIEARLYAEDPARDFLPATGRIALWRPAGGEGVRVDAGISSGLEVSPYYDPMLAKVIAWGENRDVARLRLVRAIEETVLFGPETNAPFLADILRNPTFAAGEATTGLVGEAFPDGVPAHVPESADIALAAALMLRAGQSDAHHRAGYVCDDQLGWSSAMLPPIPLRISCDSGTHDVTARCRGATWTVRVGDDECVIEILGEENNNVRSRIDGRTVDGVVLASGGTVSLAIAGRCFTFHSVGAGSEDEAGSSGRVLAPMPGLVIDIAVKEGQAVAKGDTLAVLEAMKMQHQITAAVSGTVSAIAIATGDQLGSGDLMIEITEEA